MTPELEFRSGEVRASSPGRLSGYVARYGSETRIGDFFERVMPGAFRESLADGRNIVALADHDRRALLGSTASGTLELREDDHGLAFDLRLPNTSVGRDMAALVEARIVSGCSFGFQVPAGGDTWLDRGDGSMLRELRNVSLHEVTVTPQPAYPDTALALRSLKAAEDARNFADFLRDPIIFGRRAWLETCR